LDLIYPLGLPTGLWFSASLKIRCRILQVQSVQKTQGFFNDKNNLGQNNQPDLFTNFEVRQIL
jgi:hypothetical protein